MIHNATLNRIDSPSGANAKGDRTFTTGDAIRIRCYFGEPTRKQLVDLGAIVEGATAVLIVQNPPTALEVGGRVQVLSDEEATAELLEIQHVIHPVKAGGLSHFESFLRSV